MTKGTHHSIWRVKKINPQLYRIILENVDEKNPKNNRGKTPMDMAKGDLKEWLQKENRFSSRINDDSHIENCKTHLEEEKCLKKNRGFFSKLKHSLKK